MTSRSLQRGLLALFVLLVVPVILVVSASSQSQAQAGTVVINEVMASNANSIIDGDGQANDWVELHNTTGTPIDIAGWTISDSTMTWVVPSGQAALTTIPASGYLIIWASDKGDPGDPDFPGPIGELHANFKLTAAGETLVLRNAASMQVDTITFPALVTDQSYGTDGMGGYGLFALVDTTPGSANGTVAPTATATPVPPVGVASIVFNEVMASNDTTTADEEGDFEDWFELYNPTCSAVDISGWTLADSVSGWQIPAGTVLNPGQTLFVWASDKGGDPLDPPPSPFHANFQITSLGETLSLIDLTGALVAQVTTPMLNPDESFGLDAADSYVTYVGGQITPNTLNPGQSEPDCQPPTVTPTATATATPEPTVTPGGPTVTPTPTPTPTMPTPTPTAVPTITAVPTATPVPCSSFVVINEIQPRNDFVLDGDGDSSDWIELYNPGPAAVDLSNWGIADSGTPWTVPVGTSIGADSYLLVWASDKGDAGNTDFPGPTGELHTDFRLSGAGETVSLRDGTNCEIDRVVYPAMQENQSWGRNPDGGTFVVFDVGTATPLDPNGSSLFGPEPTCVSPDSGVRMSRIVARNDGLILDGDGDDSDFIEIESLSYTPINLIAWQISDSSETWIIPDLVVQPFETVTIWASGKGFLFDDDYPGPAGEAHASFRLSSGGEQVTLAEPSGCIADQATYPAMGSNEYFGFDSQGQRRVLLPGGSELPCAAVGSVRIAALQAKNDSTRTDEDGDFGDWIEFVNTTDDPIDLSSWVIQDDDAIWLAPDGVNVPVQGTLLVWADEKDRSDSAAALHTNFKLSSGGETITIGSSVDCMVDTVTYPELDDDQILRLGEDDVYSVGGGALEKKSDDTVDDAGPTSISVTAGCVAINEIMAKNDSTIEDEDGEFGDWIELVNLSDDAIDLSGWTIADEQVSWTLPDDVTIEADGFVLIWADEADRGAVDEELHSNFKLGGSGEPITLRDSAGETVASLSSYPELDDDESFGADGDGGYAVFAAGDSSPGDGPVANSGCDFEARFGALANVETDPSELATTGSTSRPAALTAQFLLVGGVALVLVARVATRRADVI